MAQVHAMQAAAYMHAITLSSAAAAASRAAYGGMPGGCNPYMFPYGNPYGGTPYDYNMLQQGSGGFGGAGAAAPSHSSLLEARQKQLAATQEYMEVVRQNKAAVAARGPCGGAGGAFQAGPGARGAGGNLSSPGMGVGADSAASGRGASAKSTSKAAP